MARFPRPYCATEPVRTVPFFNLYDDIQITQLGSTGLATTLGAAGIAQVPAFSRACRGRRPRRGTQHDPGAPRRHRRGDRVSPGVIHVTAPRRRSGAGSRGGEGLVAPTTRSSRRHTPGQVTPNDTSGRHSGRFSPFFAPGTVPCNPSELCQITCPIRRRGCGSHRPRIMLLAYPLRRLIQVLMISQSRDGRRIAAVCERFGMRTIVGSSSRAGVRALAEVRARTRARYGRGARRRRPPRPGREDQAGTDPRGPAFGRPDRAGLRERGTQVGGSKLGPDAGRLALYPRARALRPGGRRSRGAGPGGLGEAAP